MDARGPHVQALAIRQCVEQFDIDEDLRRLEQLPLSAEQQAEIAMIRANRPGADTAAKIKAYTNFVEQVESGRLPARGYDLRLLASIYYRLGAAQFKAENSQGLLTTYGKLTALTPHFADMHYNLGIALYEIARTSQDPKHRASLKQAARREFEQQIEYNWKGKPTDELREWIRKTERLPDAAAPAKQ
jgi:hypothetical protein